MQDHYKGVHITMYVKEVKVVSHQASDIIVPVNGDLQVRLFTAILCVVCARYCVKKNLKYNKSINSG